MTFWPEAVYNGSVLQRPSLELKGWEAWFMDRILVVDDDPLILAALSRILQSEGYQVVTHSDPAQAAKEEGFQVVLTDFMMPLLNGVELLRTLREKNPRAVRLMLTAAADFRTASEAVNRGEVFRLLGKPWSLS